ncbi:major allergen Asp F2 [Aspergillus thermomutatus]|uniref:Putative peptidase domain-containing protein n=1 Tax=Aspergillus thermomutatus TaxID=41047 RepID=A0A397HQF6_ASPTH|nr:uncharacterized protein CDV56_101026 [Aspergillus thermomutatus]RHZ65157.1 hypothetical protein CDV56_101026 [Aspergillus thermomutatus]
MAALLRLAVLLPLVAALPTSPLSARATPHEPAFFSWNAGAVTSYPIHSSCNTTQRRQIEAGLDEAIALAEHAKAHILRWGNESDIYRKYFGGRPSMEAIGAYDVVLNGDKGNVLFRCDNPDGNCALEGWGGHWRGENATDETVICDRSYTTRRSLLTMCAQGYTVSGSETNTFWAADLLHRLYHMPAVGQGWIEHFADGYEEVLDLAKGDGTEPTHDSETLQYFALEAYAFDVAVPGVGCPGESHDHEHESEAGAGATATATATATAAQTASVTSEVPAVENSIALSRRRRMLDDRIVLRDSHNAPVMNKLPSANMYTVAP